ncbi:uncharacterized protein LOC106641800 isoform X2 [Copidosoma floridanum]|nr:uncharacterized protein LOC106641800 isoform X2 [Copidosoma floridanum]
MLLGCTVLVGLSICLWGVAIGTNHWLEARVPEDGRQIVVEEIGVHRKIFQAGNSGLFRVCTRGFRQENVNASVRPYQGCNQNEMFPVDAKAKRERRTEADLTLINYYRTNVSLAIIGMFIMVMGFGFSIYTFLNPRYMFKRLAGGIHFLTCACVMVVIQVLTSIREHVSKRDNWIFPRSAELNYGYSFCLAWLVFSCNLSAGCAFMIFSRKRKRDRAPNDEFAMADEPTIIGR